MDTQIAETIAGQLHSTKPNHLTPGEDVGMEAIPNGLHVMVIPYRKRIRIVLDQARDLYDVTIHDPWDNDEPVEFTGIFCDQLAEFVWGDDAKPWNLPMGSITDLETGETVAEW